MKIIYFAPESTTKAPPDPFLEFLKQDQDDLIVISGGLPDIQIVDQMRKFFLSLPRKERIVVILAAFINPSQEEVADDRWSPSKSALPSYLSISCPDHIINESKTLRSLQLFWFLWNRYGSRIVFLVSLDRIQIKPFARIYLSGAFRENRSCEMYRWDYPFLKSLARNIRGRVEV